jgi:hypothetical protein
VTFATLTCRANNGVPIGCSRKIKIRNDMADYAIGRMSKASVPVY